jgi:hypothetical protein
MRPDLNGLEFAFGLVVDPEIDEVFREDAAFG